MKLFYIGGINLKNEYTAEDFEKSVKNPYYNMLNKKTQVAVRHEIFQVFYEIGKKNGVSPEIIMSRCLTDYAKKLQESDEAEK